MLSSTCQACGRADPGKMNPGGAGEVSEIATEIPGTVVAVLVEDGRQVTRGDSVAVLESMKMEIPVLAETDGVVVRVLVAPGDAVRAHAPVVLVTR